MLFVGHWYPVLDFWWYLLWDSKPGWIPSAARFLTCIKGFQIHFWWDTCSPLDSQHGSRAFLIHILVHMYTQILTGFSFLFQCWTYFWPSHCPPPRACMKQVSVRETSDRPRGPGVRHRHLTVTATDPPRPPHPTATRPHPSGSMLHLDPPQSSRALQYHLFPLFGTNILEINHSSWDFLFWRKTDVGPNSSVIYLSERKTEVIKTNGGNLLRCSLIFYT